MKQMILLALGLMVFSLNAQSLQWAKQIAGTSSGHTMAIDAAGNVYTLGTFRYTADFDPSVNTYNMTSNGEGDIFITKFDAIGNFIWALQLGAQYYNDIPGNIAFDSNGNIVVAGSFQGTIDLDPGVGEHMVTTEGKEAFLVKLDTNGNLLWATHWGGNDYLAQNNVYTVVLDGADNIIIGGGFFGTNDLDPGAGTFTVSVASYEDAYLSKLDANGNFLWAITIGGDSPWNDQVNAVAVDDSGNITFGGKFYGNVPAYNLTGNGNFYIKLDASGNLVWSKQTTGSGSILTVTSLKIDADNNTYITGGYLGTCDFDPGAGVYNLSSSGGYIDIFILKLNAAGDFVWATGFGGEDGLDTSKSIELDGQGYLYVTGHYKGTADFAPGTEEFLMTPIGHIDMFLLKLDTDGNFEYANTFGSAPNGDTIGHSVHAQGNGTVFLTGSFQNTTDFDPSGGVYNLISTGGDNCFMLKLNGDPLGITKNNLLPISLYPNPSKGSFTVDLGKEFQNATVEISNMMGQIISSEKYSSVKTITQQINASAGIYFVKVSTAKEGSNTLRIIKQ
ncbi:SBBP repeat-containing protein [Aequorivita todarodis]|uniref:SBBP repeat-containing protein n=1 Tax=Aequorivita todarodis TaxID=2036821 RepID=UPI002350592C|nr:SBBP repeat-containing protein [Aequorivita todarodis]MDC8001707.1 SBBP repeat-containing protein [Aequorivita todarodis]